MRRKYPYRARYNFSEKSYIVVEFTGPDTGRVEENVNGMGDEPWVVGYTANNWAEPLFEPIKSEETQVEWD